MADFIFNMKKKYDSKTLAEALKEIKQEFSKQGSDYIPQLEKLNANLDGVFEEIINSLKEEYDTSTLLSKNLDMETAKLKEIENKEETEKDISEKINSEIESVKACIEKETSELTEVVNEHMILAKECADDFRETPMLYEDEQLKSEVKELKKKADRLMENLSAMEKEVSLLQQFFLNNGKQEDAYKAVTTVMKDAGDADFMITLLNHREKGWIEKNKKLSQRLAKEESRDGDGTLNKK